MNSPIQPQSDSCTFKVLITLIKPMHKALHDTVEDSNNAHVAY